MTSSSDDIPTIYGGGGPLAHVPDDVTIPQFFWDGHHPFGGRPLLLRRSTYFIEDATGREFSGTQVSTVTLSPFATRPRAPAVSASRIVRLMCPCCSSFALLSRRNDVARSERARGGWQTHCTCAGTLVSPAVFLDPPSGGAEWSWQGTMTSVWVPPLVPFVVSAVYRHFIKCAYTARIILVSTFNHCVDPKTSLLTSPQITQP